MIFKSSSGKFGLFERITGGLKNSAEETVDVEVGLINKDELWSQQSALLMIPKSGNI